MSWDIESFREKLEDQHEFPGPYTFKFIVPSELKDDLLALLPQAEVSLRESANGKYVSVTLSHHLETSQGVLDVYIAANQIDGLIAL